MPAPPSSKQKATNQKSMDAAKASSKVGGGASAGGSLQRQSPSLSRGSPTPNKMGSKSSQTGGLLGGSKPSPPLGGMFGGINTNKLGSQVSQVSPLMQKAMDRNRANTLKQQYSQYRSPPGEGVEDLTRAAYDKQLSPVNAMGTAQGGLAPPTGASGEYLVNRVKAQEPESIYGPSGLRGLLGPQGQPRIQPTPYGNAYQTAQMLRGAYPNVAARTDQTDLTESLNTLGQAMPSEADIGRYGVGAMNDIGRVGLNQVIGGFSPSRMVRNMDSTGLRPGTKGLGYMVGADSPEAMQAQIGLREALQNQGVSPQARNASNFVAAGTRMVPGVNPVGEPVRGTQFGADPTWGNRIATRNDLGAPRLASAQPGSPPVGPTQTASISPAAAPPAPQQPQAETGPSFWQSIADAGKAAYNAVDENLIQPTQEQVAKYGGFERAGKLAQAAVSIMGFMGGSGLQKAQAYAAQPGTGGGNEPATAPLPNPAPAPVNPVQSNPAPVQVPWQYPQYQSQWAGLPGGIGVYARG